MLSLLTAAIVLGLLHTCAQVVLGPFDRALFTTCGIIPQATRAGLITRTAFFRSAPGPFIGAFDFITNDLLGVAETVQGGGDCLAFMVADASLEGRTGVYFNNMTTGVPALSPGHSFVEKDPSEEAQQAALGDQLWQASAALVGLAA